MASGAPGYGHALLGASKKPWMIKVYEFQDRMMPGQWEEFSYRKVFINEQVKQAIEAGAEQVLILGAGFDTLCLRLAPCNRNVSFFERDHPTTSQAKAKGVASCGSEENLHLIAADLSNSSLRDALLQTVDWDASKLSVVVAEGLLQYLNDADVHLLFQEVARCVPLNRR